MSTESTITFGDLGLPESILQSITQLGYETPTPIQAKCIPLLLEGRDLIGQAQTGTGKTAAFALPFLSRIDADKNRGNKVQVLVLTPTRELALQVAEAFQSYARHIKGFQILSVYGGQSYEPQLRALKKGVQVVVGTPGRVMDHIRKGSLALDDIKALVLDEADEMLRMGFIDDVQWILEQTPEERQIALFSATMPAVIRKVANKYLRDEVQVQIQQQSTTAKTIDQKYCVVKREQKIEALARILEVEKSEGVLVFVRTKTMTTMVADKLSARGYACDALNGDLAQSAREQKVDRLKSGRLDILVATDVAARGLDVDRITHVFNFDIPHDTESYVHRIGRTGRAGRLGKAISFVSPRETGLLKDIERVNHVKIEKMKLPTAEDVNQQRLRKFREKILEVIQQESGLEEYETMLKEFIADEIVDPIQVAAALAKLLHGDQKMSVSPVEWEEELRGRGRGDRNDRGDRGERGDRGDRGSRDRGARTRGGKKAESLRSHPNMDTERYCGQGGLEQGIKPGNIVGAIANESGIDSSMIGHIELLNDQFLVDLPAGMPSDVLNVLKKTRICGIPAQLTKFTGEAQSSAPNMRKRSAAPRAARSDRAPRAPKGAKTFNQAPRKRRSVKD
jgi:ATP-dependent RNA helicase DeaD